MTATLTDLPLVTDTFRPLRDAEIDMIAGAGAYRPVAVTYPSGYTSAKAYSTGFGASNATAAASPGTVAISMASAATSDPGTAWASAIAQA